MEENMVILAGSVDTAGRLQESGIPQLYGANTEMVLPVTRALNDRLLKTKQAVFCLTG